MIIYVERKGFVWDSVQIASLELENEMEKWNGKMEWKNGMEKWNWELTSRTDKLLTQIYCNLTTKPS